MKIAIVAVLRIAIPVATKKIAKKIATETSPENTRNHGGMKRPRREEFEKKRNGKMKRNLEVKVILVSYQVRRWGSKRLKNR